MFLKVPQTREDITLPWLNQVFAKYSLLVHSFKWTGAIEDGLAVLGCLERLSLQVTNLAPNANINNIHNIHNMDNQNPLRTLNTIVKTLPSGPAGLRHFIINEGFCQRELKMYSEVFPAWEKFQDSRNTPKKYRFQRPTCYYGAEEGEGDNYNMIIIMEDMFDRDLALWPHGFRRGLKWKQAKPMVKQIALFHAVGMAYKEDMGIKNYSEEYPFLHTASKDQEAFKYFLKTGIDETVKRLEGDEGQDENSLPIPKGLVAGLRGFEKDVDKVHDLGAPRDGRAGTICHHDLHVNNIMVPQSQSGRGESALLDFQGCCYSSPMNDLTFFLLLNCDPHLFTQGLAKVLRYYQEVFTSAISSMDSGVYYSLQEIEEDYSSCVILSIIHVILGAPSWCFGPRTSQDTWRRFKMALVDTYHRVGLRIPTNL